MPEQPPKPIKSSLETLRKAVEAVRAGLETTTIKGKTPEGREISFDFEKTRQYWIQFYKQHNLPEIAQELEKTRIKPTPEQIQRIQELAEREGFDYFILLPTPETQQANLTRIKQETEKPMPNKEQYADEGTLLFSDTVQPNFPNKIKTLNRPTNKPYLLFVKSSKEVPPETLNKTPNQLRLIFKQKKLTGLTLAEYLIFQRNYTEQNKKHPEHTKVTWLLDSELSPDSSGPGQALSSGWYPKFHQVDVNSLPRFYHDSDFGARSSAIFEI